MASIEGQGYKGKRRNGGSQHFEKVKIDQKFLRGAGAMQSLLIFNF